MPYQNQELIRYNFTSVLRSVNSRKIEQQEFVEEEVEDYFFTGNNGQQFLIKQISSEKDKHAAIAFMRANWAQIHTVTENFAIDSEAVNRMWTVVYERAFKLPTSLIIYAENGEVAGLKMNSVYEGAQLPDVTFDKVAGDKIAMANSDKKKGLWTDQDVLEAMRQLLPQTLDPLEKFKLFFALLWKDIVREWMPDCKRLFKFENLAINPKYIRLGLAQELVSRSLYLGRHMNCDYAATSSTSIGSQCVQRKCGLLSVRKIAYLDLADEDPIFRKWEGNNSRECHIFYVKL